MNLVNFANLAPYQLHQGDCLDILPNLPDNSIDAVITDPPYLLAAGSNLHLAGKTGSWGDMMNTAYWFAQWYKESLRVLKPDGCFWAFCNWRTIPIAIQASMRAGMGITSMVIWDKKYIGPAGPKGLRARYEVIVLIAKPDFIFPNRRESDIWEYPKLTYKKYHPAEKPVGLLQRIISSSNKSSKIILDPFMGSGTTGVAAIRQDCHFIGIETEPRYLLVAEERLRAENLLKKETKEHLDLALPSLA